MLLILLRIYAKMQISAGTRAHAPPRNDRFNSAGVGESSSSHFADESSRQQRRVIGKLQGFDSRFIGRDRSTARAAAWETQVKVADAARQWQCRPYLEGALMLLSPPTSSHLLPLRSSVFVGGGASTTSFFFSLAGLFVVDVHVRSLSSNPWGLGGARGVRVSASDSRARERDDSAGTARS